MNGRHVLVTGGAGFIGSHLADALLARGAHVCALDDLSTGRLQNIGHLEDHPGFQLVVGSVLDAGLVDKFVERADLVMHLAAAVGVRRIVEHPLESLRTNIRGTELVLEAADRYRKKTLIASTSEVYGKGDNVPFCETDDRLLGPPLRLRWSYSTSKAIDEILAYAYWRDRSLPTVIARLFNTVGPRQTGAYGMVVPRFVGAALSGEPIQVYGDGEQTRAFCHVLDVVEALIGLAEHPEAVGEVFNVGSPEEVSINELAARVLAATGSDSPVTHVPYEEAYDKTFEDLPRRVPDTNKIRGLMAWQPRRNLDQILSDVILGHDPVLAAMAASAERAGAS